MIANFKVCRNAKKKIKGCEICNKFSLEKIS